MDQHLFTRVVLALLTKRYDQLRRTMEAHGISGPAVGSADRVVPTVRQRMVGAGAGVAHRWHGTKLQLKKPDGNWGAEVELRGPGGGVSIVRSIGVEAPPQPERIQRSDYDDTRFTYVGFASRVVRIDYSVHPPLREVAASGDWDTRRDLAYAAG